MPALTAVVLAGPAGAHMALPLPTVAAAYPAAVAATAWAIRR